MMRHPTGSPSALPLLTCNPYLQVFPLASLDLLTSFHLGCGFSALLLLSDPASRRRLSAMTSCAVSPRGTVPPVIRRARRGQVGDTSGQSGGLGTMLRATAPGGRTHLIATPWWGDCTRAAGGKSRAMRRCAGVRGARSEGWSEQTEGRLVRRRGGRPGDHAGSGQVAGDDRLTVSCLEVLCRGNPQFLPPARRRLQSMATTCFEVSCGDQIHD